MRTGTECLDSKGQCEMGREDPAGVMTGLRPAISLDRYLPGVQFATQERPVAPSEALLEPCKLKSRVPTHQAGISKERVPCQT